MGGYLPSAEQLIGAAPVVSLESTINDNPGTALVETDPTEAIQDQREMSSTLVTTAAGADAAGSEGVTEGSTGNPNEGQPAPTPEPPIVINRSKPIGSSSAAIAAASRDFAVAKVTSAPTHRATS